MTKRLQLLLILLAPVVLYFPSFTTYFAGDDFFHFSVSRISSVWDVIRFFGFYPFADRGIAFYRPLLREVLYGTYYLVFGLKTLPFRVFAMGLHVANSFLVYQLGKRLLKSEFTAAFAALFFGVASANVGILYYLAGGIQAQGATLFALLSVLAFTAKKRIAAFSFFLAGLASHEQAVAVPIVLAGVIWLDEKKPVTFIKRALSQLWVFAFVTVGYLYANLYLIGFSSAEVQYKPIFSLATTLNTLGWYVGWALGLPEMLIDFVNSGFSLNPSLMHYWGSYFRVIFPAFFACLGIIVLVSVLQLPKIIRDKRVYFLNMWFLAALLPVVFLPLHKKQYYLAPAMPAFWLLVGHLINGVRPRKKLFNLMAGALTFSLIVLTVASVKLSERTYWAINRAKVASAVLSDLKTQYPDLPQGATLYIKNDPNYPFISESWGGTSTQTSLALSGPDAIRLIYDDLSINVLYQDMLPTLSGKEINFTAIID